MINIGVYNTLKVVRKSDLGYMLTDGEDEILMHFKQATAELENDSEVKVFVYTDKEKRLCATMIEPICTLEEANFVSVVNVLPKIGVFVGINTPKDVLISKDYLPYNESEWPMIGDLLFIKLKLHNDILIGKPLNRFDIIELHSKFSYENYPHVDGYVARVTEKGLGIITVDKAYVFVPITQYRGTYRLGQKVDVCITKVLEQGDCYGTLNAHKEELMDEDKEIIMNFLKAHRGIMRLTAKSSSEEIEALLKMSRKAFKRAYGGLYKDRKIEFDDEKTFLVETQDDQE